MSRPSEVTMILRRAAEGDSSALESLLPMLYEELRSLARREMAGEGAGATLQPTALVHEAWVRLVGDAAEPVRFEGRSHFFGAAARAMRRVLVEAARRRRAIKRGGDLGEREPLRADALAYDPAIDDSLSVDSILDIDRALTSLAAKDPRKAELVQLRYFGGMTVPEVAELLGVSVGTAQRDWRLARAFLLRELSPPHDE